MATAGEPDQTEDGGLGRRRTILIGLAITTLLGGVSGIAYLSHTAGSATGARRTTPGSSVPIAAHFPEQSGPSSTRVDTTTTTTPAETPPATVVQLPGTTAPAILIVTPPVSSPPETTPATEPPPTTSPPTTILGPAVTDTLPPPPPPFGADALTWDAPHMLKITAGRRATFWVRAHNPTDRVVSLAHPLACTPRLEHDELCAGLAQLIAPGAFASATYTIDATDAAPGNYTLVVEGVLTVPVTVS